MNLYFCENCRTVYLSDTEDGIEIVPDCRNRDGCGSYGTPCRPVDAVYTMRSKLT